MFSECKNRLLLTGHLHSKKTTSYLTNLEKFGMEWIQCPSLASTDRWHDTKGFIGNKRRMMSLVVNIEEGITDHKYYNVK
jgi:hypothetical protein